MQVDKIFPREMQYKIKNQMQSPVFLSKNSNFLHNINQNNSQMPKINKQADIWEQLLKFTQQNPIDFEDLEQHYDIGKLELEKITAHQLRSKRKQFSERDLNHNSQQSKTWQQNQYRIFVWFFLAYMKFYDTDPHQFTQVDWNQIANSFKKYAYVCEYFCYSCKKSKSEPWTSEEDEIISRIMPTMNKKWTSIGLQLYRLTNKRRLRKPKAIRERWLSHLNPNIKKVDWTLQQELQLILKIKDIGKKWSRIAKKLGNRSEHTVKNRYHKMILKFKKKNQYSQDLYHEEQILNFIEKQIQEKIRQEKSQKYSVKEQYILDQALEEKKQTQDKDPVKIQQDQGISCQTKNAFASFAPIIIVFEGFNAN